MERFDVFIIGGGGTGSEIALSLGRSTGLKVGLAERDKLGGECNHYGCVPTKVMLRSAKIAALARDAGGFGVRIPSVMVDVRAVQQRARDVIAAQSGAGAEPFERLGISVLFEEARLVGEHRVALASGTQIEAANIVLTTGTRTVVPEIAGLREGPYWTNKEAIWSPQEAPNSLAVLGTGAIGIEFAQVYARFGSNVVAIESAPHILPSEDEEAATALQPALEEDGIRVLSGTTIEAAEHGPNGWTLRAADAGTIRADELLVATGRTPVFDGHDLHAAHVDLDEKGRPVLTETLRTTNEAIWAAGDATGDLLFTHVGSYEAGIVVADIRGAPRPRDYRVVPRVTFCDPEVASVGLTERQARASGPEIKVGRSQLDQNERALIDGRRHGLVKVIADAGTGELLGGLIVAEESGAMIHELVAMMAGRIPASDVAHAIHAYPTLSESVKDALEDLARA